MVWGRPRGRPSGISGGLSEGSSRKFHGPEGLFAFATRHVWLRPSTVLPASAANSGAMVDVVLADSLGRRPAGQTAGPLSKVGAGSPGITDDADENRPWTETRGKR
jgi:hypothetical protein